MRGRNLVVVGGGVGGLVAANELRRMLPPIHRVILVEKNSMHAFAPSFLWLMTGARKPDEITTPLQRLIRPGVEIIQSAATRIDIGGGSVDTATQTVPYDYLIIAVGSELVPQTVPGLVESAYSFYSFEETRKLQVALKSFTGGNITVVVCSLPYKCPGAPHEGAMLIADHFRQRGQRDNVDIHLYTPEPQPMPVAGPQLGESVKKMLSSKGISFHPLHKLLSVDSQARTLAFDGKGTARFDLLVAIPPHRSASIVREAGLTNDAGWVPVDRLTLMTKHENIYAIGDTTAIGIPGRWNPDIPMMLPKAGVFAHVQAEIVAQRIANEILGRPAQPQFRGTGYCMLEAGEGLAGFAYGDFFGVPSPKLEFRNIGRAWHVGKVLFEKWWLSPFGLRKHILRAVLAAGAKIFKIPINI